MKKILLILFILISAIVFSQNPILYNKNWKVEKAIVNGIEKDITDKPDGYFSIFSPDFFYNYVSNICAENYGKATFSTSSDDFIITEANVSSPHNCSIPLDFDSSYSLFFTKNSSEVNKVTYDIKTISNGYRLTLTNISGDQLIYGYYNTPTTLSGNHWTVTSLNINGAVVTPQITTNYLQINPDGGILVSYYNGGSGNAGFYPDNRFCITNFAITLSMTDDPFDTLYLGGFFSVGRNQFPYSYNFSDNGETLIITKYNGDFATYTKKAMAVSETEKPQYKIYPNPTSDLITIENLTPNTIIELVDNSGKMVKKAISGNFTKTDINIKNITAGVYYLKINNQSVQKVIKK